MAASVMAPWSTSATAQEHRPAGVPDSGWFNTGPEEYNEIFDNGSIRISWGPVYVKPSDSGGDPPWIYYVIRYENYSNTDEKLDCGGYSDPSTVRQLVAPTKDDLGERFSAEKTVCSDTDGQWWTTLTPGKTLEQGAWFDEVPPTAGVVSLELQDDYGGFPGSSEYQSPYWEKYDGPPRDTPSGP